MPCLGVSFSGVCDCILHSWCWKLRESSNVAEGAAGALMMRVVTVVLMKWRSSHLLVQQWAMSGRGKSNALGNYVSNLNDIYFFSIFTPNSSYIDKGHWHCENCFCQKGMTIKMDDYSRDVDWVLITLEQEHFVTGKICKFMVRGASLTFLTGCGVKNRSYFCYRLITFAIIFYNPPQHRRFSNSHWNFYYVAMLILIAGDYTAASMD